MSYRVNGNVIIDNGGNVTLANFPLVGKPTNLEPTGGNTAYGVTLLMSDYTGFYEGTIPRKFSQFQVANINTFVAGNIVYDSGNIADTPNSNIIITLTTSETYYWRGRYSNNNDVYSEFSDASEFVYGGLIAPPDGLGCPYQGGYFTGNIDIGGGVCYYLVVAPNSTGCAVCQWKTTNTTTSGTGSCVNGYTNTYPPLANATHPAGNFTATRTIAGFSDWYLPARDELNVLYTNRGSMPAGEGYASDRYKSSTECSPQNSMTLDFANGSISSNDKNATDRVRAVRRVAI